VLAISLAVSVPAFAETKDNEKNASNNNSTNYLVVKDSGIVLDNNSAQTNAKSKFSGESKVGNTKISKVLTFNQIVEQIAKDNNISKNEAASQVKSNFSGNSSLSITAERATYRTITETVPIWSNYQPQLAFYCQTSEEDYFHGIVKIMNVSLIRAYNGYSKQFSGTVYTNLEDANSIHWIIDGDFYNNGTTTVSGGGSIGIGGVATLNFGISYASNWFGYTNYPGDTTW